MITAKVIAHSISPKGKEIVTFEVEYPRMVHAELLTHRSLSRNSASSRAIPILKMISLVWKNPATPVHWGKNQGGMSAKEELTGLRLFFAKFLWNFGSKMNCALSYALHLTGAHKQIANRITEPFSHIKVVITATEWNNFFALRNHPDAQPEIQALAKAMLEAKNHSAPKKLNYNEWHLPYVDDSSIPVELAKKISASMCAQVSYRKADDTPEKAGNIFKRLIESAPVHASPVEHQATPSTDPEYRSGNFVGWSQFRQQIPNNVVHG